MEHSFFTGIGTREQNEDVILIEQVSQNNKLFLVVDGMGGYEKGEVAAKLVADNIVTYLRTIQKIDFSNVQKAVNKANLAVKQYNEANQITSGATLGGVVFSGNSAICFWLGDVKIYYIKNNKLVQESQSHSFLNEMSDSDFSKSPENFKRYGHIVTRSVSGKREKTNLDFFKIDHLSAQDSFIICSDGVHNTMTVQHMNLLLSTNTNTSVIEDYLNTHAKDNFSLINIIKK
ncbi:PP2C family protein-serine/threonine phosphatase [Chryseobacterium sp. M5]|uniref:PP2C family protein-serine/threonine phosphatase n=1 Tax=Chryseobacterium sp. M5 TaxID=3379128 RepID=UPI003857463A